MSIDPELIGGIKVIVGDQMLDASVRSKLDAMATALNNWENFMQLNPSEISELIRARSRICRRIGSAHPGYWWSP